MTGKEALARWYYKLHTEWLQNWMDMPETQFRWWNLLVVALDDAID